MGRLRHRSGPGKRIIGVRAARARRSRFVTDLTVVLDLLRHYATVAIKVNDRKWRGQMTRYLLSAVAFMLMMAGCATVDTDHFARVPQRAMKYEVPLYYSIPPVGYAYRDIGPVTGAYSMGLFDEANDSSFKALKEMSSNAKAMGANAVIDVKNMPAGWRQSYFVGEAVVFDKLPSDK